MLAALLLAAASPVSADGPDPFGMEAWTDCLVRNRERFLSSDEPAETVATATLSSCTEAEKAASEKLLAYGAGRVDQVRWRAMAQSLSARSRKRLRDALLGYFVEARLPKRKR